MPRYPLLTSQFCFASLQTLGRRIDWRTTSTFVDSVDLRETDSREHVWNCGLLLAIIDPDQTGYFLIQTEKNDDQILRTRSDGD